MTPQQLIDSATADGFFLALTMATTKGLAAGPDEMMAFLRHVANGELLARESEADELARYERALGREATDDERAEFLRQGRESRLLAAREDVEVAVRILRAEHSL